MAFEDLYQEIILDHYKHPRNHADLSHLSDDHAHENPSCGDSLKLEVKLEDGRISSIAFDGQGCAISMSSASMMTERVKGKTLAEAAGDIESFLSFMRGEKELDLEADGEMAALAGVVKFPLRVKCATLG